jgi:hypothetical protein
MHRNGFQSTLVLTAKRNTAMRMALLAQSASQGIMVNMTKSTLRLSMQMHLRRSRVPADRVRLDCPQRASRERKTRMPDLEYRPSIAFIMTLMRGQASEADIEGIASSD